LGGTLRRAAFLLGAMDTEECGIGGNGFQLFVIVVPSMFV
jgi:hypothetical protein